MSVRRVSMYSFAAAGESDIQTPEIQAQKASNQSAVPPSMSSIPIRFTRYPPSSVDDDKLKGEPR